jgi:hypothetical protein
MKMVVLITTLALGGSALCARAQYESGPPPGGPDVIHGAAPLPPIIFALDANHDGVIDSNEIANASAALKTLDKNGDGQLSEDELLPPHADGHGPDGPPNRGNTGQRPPPPPLVAALDVNHDGVIDSNEIANASAALKTLDKNGDGKLTEDELFPPPPAGQRGGVLPGNPQGSTVVF